MDQLVFRDFQGGIQVGLALYALSQSPIPEFHNEVSLPEKKLFRNECHVHFSMETFPIMPSNECYVHYFESNIFYFCGKHTNSY